MVSLTLKPQLQKRLQGTCDKAGGNRPRNLPDTAANNGNRHRAKISSRTGSLQECGHKSARLVLDHEWGLSLCRVFPRNAPGRCHFRSQALTSELPMR